MCLSFSLSLSLSLSIYLYIYLSYLSLLFAQGVPREGRDRGERRATSADREGDPHRGVGGDVEKGGRGVRRTSAQARGSLSSSSSLSLSLSLLTRCLCLVPATSHTRAILLNIYCIYYILCARAIDPLHHRRSLQWTPRPRGRSAAMRSP